MISPTQIKDMITEVKNIRDRNVSQSNLKLFINGIIWRIYKLNNNLKNHQFYEYSKVNQATTNSIYIRHNLNHLGIV